MNDRRSTRILRALLSLAATLGLLVGVPVLLARWVGWPLPTSVPSLESLEQGPRSGIPDEVVVNTLAVIAWLAWAQLALAIVTETIAQLRGRDLSHRLALPGFQVTAARLVAGIVMVASTVQPVRAHAAPTPIPAVAETTTPAVAPPPIAPVILDLTTASSTTSTDMIDLTTSGPDTADPPTVTVQRHDSYWAIAERTLGDGLRWQEILDLNAGRTLPDGTTIVAGDQMLYAGWVLVLPADAAGGPSPQPLEQSGGATSENDWVETEAVVESGDNLWSISEDRIESDLGRPADDLEVAPYWQEVVEANEDRYVQPGNPNLIYPGQVLVLPATEQPEPGAPTGTGGPAPDDEVASTDVDPVVVEPLEVPAPPVAPEAPESAGETASVATSTTQPIEADSPDTVGASARVEASEREGGAGDSSLPQAIAVGGLSSAALAVGFKRLLDRRRRRFANANPGQAPGGTPPEHRELHQAVVAQADERRVDDLQDVLGRLSATLAVAGSERRPRMIRHAEDSLEVLLDKPDTNAPDGWGTTEDGAVWTLTEGPDADEPYDGPLSPSPLMVTIGQPEDDAQLYLDLEADGVISLTGDPSVAANLARSIVTELTLSPLADTLRVIAVGDVVDADAKALDHLTIVDSWDGHIEDLTTWSSESNAALVENGWANAFIGRGNDPDHDALTPIAVVADRPPPPELAASLLSAQPSSVAVVVLGGFPEARATLRCEDDAINLDMFGVACSPQELEADELAAMSSVLVAADSPMEQELLERLQAEYISSESESESESEPEPESESEPEPVESNCDGLSSDSTPSDQQEDDDDVADCSDAPPPCEVLVRLLGDITVEGGGPLKPKATAVVAFVAMHRSVTTARMEEACWFGSDGTTHNRRIHDTMAEARSALGSQHFPANRGGRYVAGPLVRTDLDLFDWHVQRAADLPPDQAVDEYRSALDLVRGKPFSYPNVARASYGWVDFEHHATTWELRVSGVAQACAAMHLDAGEPSQAIALLQNLVQVIPLNSALVEALMRAHIASDDRNSAEGVYQHHAAALHQAKLGDPEDSIELLRIELHAA